MMRKTALVVKYDEKYVHVFIIFCQCSGGAVVEYQVRSPEVLGCAQLVLISFLQAWRVKRKITLVLFFSSYLCNSMSETYGP
jgi:hypothetical protein